MNLKMRIHADATLTDQSGFTIVEVMVAMVIMLVGLVGALQLLNQASATTTSNKAREGGVALQRELVEAARAIPYDQLTQSSIVSLLRAKPGFTTSAIGADGWTIERRGIDFTMSVGVCVVDDPTDLTGPHDPTFCASATGSSTSENCRAALGAAGDISGTGSASTAQVGDCGIDLNKDGLVDNLTAAQTGACTSGSCGSGSDVNPEDYKRLVVLVRWKIGSGSRFALQANTVSYPGLSGAPRVSVPSMTAPSGTTANTITNDAVTSATFEATTNRAAARVAWMVDGNAAGNATDLGGGLTWRATWQLGNVSGSGASGPAANEVVDGTYVIGMRAYDSFSQAGPTRAITVTLNRRRPFMPAIFQALRVGTVLDLGWTAALERDVDGYRVFRRQGSGTPVEVCALSRSTTCYDAAPPASGTWTYYAHAYDKDANGIEREGDVSALHAIEFDNQAPSPPATLSATRDATTGNVSLTWTASAGDPDPGDAIVGYRIYRDGDRIGDRIAGTLNALAYDDTAAGTVPRTYHVAAVDSRGAESIRLTVAVS